MIVAQLREIRVARAGHLLATFRIVQLPTATATTATERAARRWQTALAARVAATVAGALFAVLLVAPVPRACVEAFGAPSAGVPRFGGLRAGWLRREPAVDTANLQQRLASRGLTATLRAVGTYVTIELPGIREDDMARVLRIVRGPDIVEIRKLETDGALDGPVMFERAEIREAVVTSLLGKAPKVAFMLWGDRARSTHLGPVRVAIVVDHEVRGTAVLWGLFADVMVLDVEGKNLAELAEALDSNTLHGGTMLYAEYVPERDLAPFVWAARVTIALAGGAVAALLALLLPTGAFRGAR